MLSRVSDKALAKTATFGAFVCVSMGFIHQFTMQQRVRRSAVYQESMKLLREHPAARSLLGDPIRTRWMQLGDNEANIWTLRQVQLQIPLRGRAQKGELHVWASRQLPEEAEYDTEQLNQTKYQIDRLELALDKEKNRRLVVFKGEAKVNQADVS